jgi:LPS export ABC transporter protein LptC
MCLSILILAFLLKPDFTGQQNAYFVSDPITTADIGIRDLSFIQTRSGEVEWNITARSAELFESEHRTILEDAHVVLHTPEDLQITFEGDQGIFDTDSHDFKIEDEDGEIKLEITNGYTILTKELEWRDRDRVIRTSQPVKISGPWFVIDGVGLTIETLSQEFIINEGVHVTLNR